MAEPNLSSTPGSRTLSPEEAAETLITIFRHGDDIHRRALATVINGLCARILGRNPEQKQEGVKPNVTEPENVDPLDIKQDELKKEGRIWFSQNQYDDQLKEIAGAIENLVRISSIEDDFHSVLGVLSTQFWDLLEKADDQNRRAYR